VARVTLDGLRLTVIPAGETAVVRLTAPEKLLTLVMLRIEVAELPAVIVMLLGLAFITKSGIVPVLKVAVWTVSGTAVGDPLVMVTQVGESLVFEQPVWNPTGIPVVDAVTL
jgi:hypothetical protein